MPVAPDLLLGIDIGNTVVKAVPFDPAGRQVARHGVDGTTLKPAPGTVERPGAELWANTRAAIAGCLGDIDPGRIAAVGLAGHGNGLYLLDRDGGPLLGIQSLDGRAAALAAELDRTAGDRLKPICGQRPWPSQTPTLLVWIRTHRPELFSQAGTLCFAKDFIGFCLTGQRAGEVSDLSGAGLLRLPEATDDAELLSLYGLADAMPILPRFCLPTEIAGQVTSAAAAATGLRAGTPVAAGYFDVVASALGSGAVGTGAASVVLGSWSINQVFDEVPSRDPGVFMVAALGPGRFANMDNCATSAANLEWFVRTLFERDGHDGEAFARVNALVGRAAVAPGDPMFHPFL
jgi:L-xylulokinase